MPSYNFKRKVKFYIVIDGLKYQLEINPDLSFSQTFDEVARRVKTLHAPKDMFDRASISKANPANFDFTMPFYVTMEVKPIFQMLLDYANSTEVTLKTADIYVDTGSEIFKLEKAVFERGTFNIAKAQRVSISISGSASKLSHFGPTGTTIPGSLQSSTVSTPFPEYYEARFMQVMVNSAELKSVISINIEISNEVEWLDNNNLHKSLAITGPSDTVYPEAFVVRGRLVAGSIQQYLTDETLTNVNKWSINTPISIKIAKEIGLYQLVFDLTECVYTNRLETAELFAQTYDFRMINSPDNLSTAIKYLSEEEA